MRGPDQCNLPRSRRARKTSHQYDTRLVRHLKRDNLETWRSVTEATFILNSTIKCRLEKIDPDLREHPRRWRIFLSTNDARCRRQYEESHRCWRIEDWAYVWWSDECSIKTEKGEVRKWAWMHSGEQYEPHNTLKRSRNQEIVMIWTCMRAHGRVVWCFCDESYGRRSHIAIAYCALLRDVLPQIYEPGQALLQDRAPRDTANATNDFRDKMGVWVVEHLLIVLISTKSNIYGLS